MIRCFGFNKCRVLILLLLSVVAGGHVLCCAHWHPCEHEHHEVLDDHSTPCCCQLVPCNHDRQCSENEQTVEARGKRVGEKRNFCGYAISTLFHFSHLSHLTTSCLRDHVTDNLSALPVRLHLFYKLLLI